MSKDTLFQPFQIKNHTLKNRIGVAPMTRMSGGETSIPRKDVLDFLVRRAENGAGLVYTEALVTDYESAQGYPGQARITTQKQIDAWKPVVQKIQDAGSKAIIQLFHCGRMAWPEINPAKRSIAPSAVAPRQDNPLTQSPYPVPEAMSQFDIDHVINGFVQSAKGAVEAGFDGIEIHGAHGYLISQFLSSYSNQRTDGYGGSVENRFRFAREVVRAVKENIPDDRLLIFRISNWGIADMEVSLFADREEWQECIRRLDEEPIDAISVSTYDFKAPAFGTDKNMAQLTREVTKLPLLICGKIYDRQTADAALEDADIALSGKSMLLNPNFVEDLRLGKALKVYSSEAANIAYTQEPLP
ncbi:NADH-dependent flavin oxidoreductase [uncultured Desulfosarcina sp.]|uniref:oxidoreductase n=1 Tax=uncultured Desulfosarcina sp. TaxID=218289 RepID=UPI0029C7F78F|nr:NADH-dependent flavin oxidoreductase [uncultured Desulfosarcina sp.]